MDARKSEVQPVTLVGSVEIQLIERLHTSRARDHGTLKDRQPPLVAPGEPLQYPLWLAGRHNETLGTLPLPDCGKEVQVLNYAIALAQDIRDSNAKAINFDAKSTSVRDVQFNPFYSNYFGAAFDNGTVQVNSSIVAHPYTTPSH